MWKKIIYSLAYISISGLSIANPEKPTNENTGNNKNLIFQIKSFLKEAPKTKNKNDITEFIIVNEKSLINLECNDQHLTIKKLSSTIKDKITLSLTCKSKQNEWKRYASITTKQMTSTVISSRALIKGQIITAEDILIKPTYYSKLRRGSFSSNDMVIGRKVLKNVSPDQIITPLMVEKDFSIKEGDSVSIHSPGSAVLVYADGVSLSNGMIGDRILVKNIRSNKTIQATIKKNGVVMAN